ncbi:MAG: twin transmembrane helix small protein [Hyphomicrobiales bacterium]|nr:twin transmembrane helix small protein [Hyphomicrobiales bacterium]MCY4048084.1 twin transmembrane helix small protein [Hyphomicrobiales bacterium]MCY4052653.1 twin transmembrane helix small protein [Hyphomicrobiales bacterium]
MEIILLISLGAVAVALFAGMWNMMRGGSASRSQTLMRWRVGLQFLAIIVLLISFYVFAG